MIKGTTLSLIFSFLFLSGFCQVLPKDSLLNKTLRFRNIGPFRGGRSLAVSGSLESESVFYFGAVGGGVWKTKDYGITWSSISDSTFGSSSVGAIAVAHSDPNVVYAGMGEPEMRGNISFGDGIYKSMDAGESWKKSGLDSSFAISKIIVDPKNPELVYVAAMGTTFGPNAQRGIFKSNNGGKSWSKILFVNDSTGAIDLAMDPFNSKILFATMWQACRTPYSLSSGGKGSGLFRSKDGGETWERISEKPGLPKGLLGKSGISFSPAKQGRIWMILENSNGGVFVSDDSGEHWRKTSDDKNLRQRPWYFSHIYADPINSETVYVLNVQFWKSIDGGNTFTLINNMHGDNHDLWINPVHPKIIIVADDGGAAVTRDGGINWSSLDIPTAQLYHINLSKEFPYRIYAAQQDNSSLSIPSRTFSFSIDRNDWYEIPTGEAGYVLPHPEKSGVSFGGNYMGSLTKFTLQTNRAEELNVWPENTIGESAGARKFRFNWTFPMFFSEFEKHPLYVGSQFVHKSEDEGRSWKIISPDLTQNDSLKIQPSGGPISLDNTGVETYCSIFSLAESPMNKGYIWAGSDDGLIHLTKDDGNTWTKVTPSEKILPSYALISCIEPSQHEQGTAWVAANRYKWNDPKPYLLKTSDFGKSWSLISSGIPENEYVRVIREDPYNKNLVYCGTEKGIWISYNGGQKWERLTLNLPSTPVHDLKIQKEENDLVVATHGRSIWILDNLEILQQFNKIESKDTFELFEVAHKWDIEGGSYYFKSMQTGENAPNSVQLNYWLQHFSGKELRAVLYTASGDSIVGLSSLKNKNGILPKFDTLFNADPENKPEDLLTLNQGLNSFSWDTRIADAANLIENNILWGGSTAGPKVPPGQYKVCFYDENRLLQCSFFEIKTHPELEIQQAEYEKKFLLQKAVLTELDTLHKMLNRLRIIRNRINSLSGAMTDTITFKSVRDSIKVLCDTLNSIENTAVQSKAKAGQDLLNYPVKLNNKLASLLSGIESMEGSPTKQHFEVFEYLKTENSIVLERFEKATLKIEELVSLLKTKALEVWLEGK